MGRLRSARHRAASLHAVSVQSADFGLTRLDVQVASSTNFLIGISDVRGDGRPDYLYHAHVLYADSVSPSRVSVNGGAVTVQGMGFAPELSAAVGSTAANSARR